MVMQTQIRQWLICSQNFFQRTYSPSTRIAADYPYNVPRSNAMFTPLLNESSLIKDVHSVKPIFSPGPDGIAVLAYSDTVPTHLFLKTACFFSIWRESLIIPLFKKGSKSDLSNYILMQIP